MPSASYVIVNVNGRPGVYTYDKTGSRTQPLKYFADIQDLIDVFNLNQDDEIHP